MKTSTGVALLSILVNAQQVASDTNLSAIEPPVPVPVPVPDPDQPVGITAEWPESCDTDCQDSAIDCMKAWNDVSDDTRAEIQALVDNTVDYVRYIEFMTKFFNYMGVFRCLFSVVLLYYQINKWFLNYKTTRFQKLILWSIQSVTMLQIIYGFYWNYRVLISCELWSRNINALIDINMFFIGIMVTYYMYTAVNMVHYFSMKGRLPRESARKRFKGFMVTLFIITLVVLIAFTVLNLFISANYMKLSLSIVTHSFGVARAIGFAVNAGILSCTIYKLKSAKVNTEDTGHLKITDAVFLLCLLVLMTIGGLISTFMRNDWTLVYIDAARDVIDFFIAMMYFKMITNFITTFRLQTKVNKNGSIDIVGIEPNGNEVFKFQLDEEQHHHLLGVAKKELSHHPDSHRPPKDEKLRKKNQFEIVSESDSLNDFSDNTTPSQMTQSNYDGQSNFISAYERPQAGSSSPMFGNVSESKHIRALSRQLENQQRGPSNTTPKGGIQDRLLANDGDSSQDRRQSVKSKTGSNKNIMFSINAEDQ